MANKQEVKKYLAHWFQLGKKVIVGNGEEILLPTSVVNGDRYSQEFEDCWQKMLSLIGIRECYLEGTHETIDQLLTPVWEILPCGRCAMPVPIKTMGMPSLLCPCFYLSTWPNNELPSPRCPVNNLEQLTEIRDACSERTNRLIDNIPSEV
ncbi:hypothetical protein A0J48_022550 [Sphaerospermopsis aphanizomenoides BCCUSP55]|uniref:hypothetical protein n=1 Tax=Sphaerospermopsis aphanizomenoides TaxID=459663 RepID=UPI000A5BA09B|nr:hypothetical protein [Sphaerospermopsis aphanizomenoides]MBK1990271.1 hypothetical protein [Sphaerospermopsis aphanizomenoides BCCUSP55]